MTLAVILSLATALRAMWVRRYTWRIPWESAATANVACQAAEIVLVASPIERWLDPRLHRLTGCWNLPDLTAHLCYMAGLAFLAHTAVSRLDMSDDQLRQFVKYRIVRPAKLFVPVAVSIFLAGGLYESDCPDLVLEHPTMWLRAYWWLYVAGIAYLLTMTGRALMIVRRKDERQRRVANVYLGAVWISAFATACFVFDAHPLVSWFAIRIELMGYAFAATYAWQARIRYLRGSDHCRRM